MNTRFALCAFKPEAVVAAAYIPEEYSGVMML